MMLLEGVSSAADVEWVAQKIMDERLTHCADQAMYEARQSVGNNFKFYQRELS